MPHSLFLCVSLLCWCCHVFGDLAKNKTKRDVIRSKLVKGGNASASLISRAIQEQAADMMCGDTVIANALKLKAPSGRITINDIKNIPFDVALKSADGFIQTQQQKRQTLRQNIATLQRESYEAMASGTVSHPDLPGDMVKSVMSFVLRSAFDGQELSEIASHDCSWNTGQGGQDSYEVSAVQFSQQLKNTIGDGKYKEVPADDVYSWCEALLPFNKTGHCNDLCSDFGNSAETIVKTQLAEASTSTLDNDLYSVLIEDERIKAGIDDCVNVRTNIRNHMDQISNICAQYDSHSLRQRSIVGSLRGLKGTMESNTESIKKQGACLSNIQHIIAADDEVDRGIKGMIQKSKERTTSLMNDIDNTHKALDELRKQLARATTAVRSMHSFRASLVLTMQSFVQIYEECVRQPLRESGLLKAVRMERDSTFKNLDQQQIWGLPASRVDQLRAKCTVVATTSAAACSRNTTLCAVGNELQKTCQKDTQAYVDGVKRTIQNKQQQVKTLINSLRSEINDHTKPVGAHVEGQPEWLRRFTNVFQSTEFFEDFVKGWISPEQAALSAGPLADTNGVLYLMDQTMENVEMQLNTRVQAAMDKATRLGDQYVGNVEDSQRLTLSLVDLQIKRKDEHESAVKVETEIKALEKERENQTAQLQRFKDELANLQNRLGQSRSDMMAAFEDLKNYAQNYFQTLSREQRIRSDRSLVSAPTQTPIKVVVKIHEQ